MRRCPLSYEPLPEGHSYSEAGLRRLHPRLASLDDLPLTAQEIRREAAQRMAKMSIQGVQPKVSLRLHLSEGRFEVVDYHGSYILKPAVEEWPNVPENEDLTMRLAAIAGIEVPSHGLIRASDRSLAFVIRRFDRVGRRQRLALEDFAQLSGRDRDTKYDSSTEQLISVINQHTTFPVLDRLKLFRRLLFCFLTGNEDAHLKNWSLLTSNDIIGLSPAYDFVNTWIVLNNPTEELALPLAGKKSNFKRSDFVDYLAKDRLALNDAIIDDELNRISNAIVQWTPMIRSSFLPVKDQDRYLSIVRERASRVGLA